MFLVRAAGNLEADGQCQLLLQRGDMAVSGPQLQLRIAIGAQPREVIVAARKQVDSAQRLRMTSVESFSQSNDCGQHANRLSKRAVQIAVALVRLLWGRLAMIAGHQRNHLDLPWIEPAQISILDQVIRMSVMPIVADVDTDVVEQRGILEPFTLLIAKPMHATCLIEDAERQARDLLRVLRPVAASFAELNDAAAAHVRIALHFANARAVAMDVIEDQPFAEREIAQRQVVGAQAAKDRIEQDRAGYAEVGPSRIQARHAKAFLDVGSHQAFPQPPKSLGGHPLISEVLGWHAFLFRERHRSEAENRP